MEKETRMNDEKVKIISSPEMVAPSNSEPIPAAINLNSLDSNNPKQIDASSSSTRNTNSTNSSGNKARSCKGCLYYSSRFKADSRNPLCVGLPRSLPSVPQHLVGQSEMEASKDGRSLIDFRYACVGYSLYMDQKEQASDGRETQTELPFCVGLEVLVDRRANMTDSASAPTIHHREDGNGLPQRRSPKPTHSTGDDFLSRFTRNANLVANGVVKNINKVGNQVKQSFEDIFYPYRRRPK